MYFGFNCPRCGVPDLEADIEIDYGGCAGSTCGPYESSYPGEPAEWHTEQDTTCDACGHVVTDDELSALHEDAIQQRIAESAYDNYEDY